MITDAEYAAEEVSLAAWRAAGSVSEDFPGYSTRHVGISPYSYTDGARAYLEEDCDAATFIERAEAAGWTLNIRHGYNDREPIRAMNGLTQAWIDVGPLAVGYYVTYDGIPLEITARDGNRWIDVIEKLIGEIR